MFAAPLPAEPPVRPPVTEGATQEYVVPEGTTPFVTSTGVTVNGFGLHIEVDISVIAGPGLTVTVNVNVGPPHVPAVGVTVYVAVCGELDAFTSVPVMLPPLPPAPPVIPPVTEGAVQL